jgi:monoamine oxidase
MTRSTSRTPAGRKLSHVRQVAQFCRSHQFSASLGLEAIANAPPTILQNLPSLKKSPVQTTASRQPDGSTAGLSIAIVGAGFAGLACGYELQKAGVRATIFEASDRTGGRCWSMGGSFGDRDSFPGQVVERGGELIDSQHHQLLAYAQEFGLELEDLSATDGDWTFYFQNQHIHEQAIVEEYLDFLQAIDTDLKQVSREPTAWDHTEFDRALDRISLAEYLDKYDVGSLARGYINASYQGEFGFDLENQTCLHFLLMNLDQQEKPLEIFSDERYHITGGNEQITRCLSQSLTDQIHLRHRLLRAARTSSGAIDLTFDHDGTTQVQSFDLVVMTVPFPSLREVDLDANLGIPDGQRKAIDQLDNGAQVKMMVNFAGRPWRDHDSNGVSHSDLPHHQVTWEANPTLATAQHSTIVHLASGKLGSSLSPDRFQSDAENFLTDFDQIYPGAKNQVRRDRSGQIYGHLESWITNPLSYGAYLCYRPGQFTAFTGLEGQSVHNLFFAGEHTHSFYEWQGFLEGAALSGVEVAHRILKLGY